MNMSRARGPRYSLEYLTFIATKRKRRAASTGGGAGDVDKEEGEREGSSATAASAKRSRTVVVPPTVTETMRDMWKEMKADGHI